MKRILIVLMSLILAFSFISCAEEPAIPEEPEHVHQWTEKEKKDATCLSDGYVLYVCTGCTEEKEEILPILPHSIEEGTNKCSLCERMIYSSLKEFNEKATLENAKGINEITLGELDYDEIDYNEHSSGYRGQGLLIGRKADEPLNHYGVAPAEKGEYCFIFKDGTINSSEKGYKDIDHLNGTAVYMLLPGNSRVVFENVTFNNVFSFGIQTYTSPWSYLDSIEFDSCTFNGIITGYCPAEKITFDSCTFENYVNDYPDAANSANNSNPIWMRPGMGSYSGDTSRYLVSMKEVVFKNNTVKGSRPVKFERIGQNCNTLEYEPKLTFLDNNFDMTYENSADKEGEDKHFTVYLDPNDGNCFFSLVDDGNTAKGGAPIYTVPSSYRNAPKTTVTDRNGKEKTVIARVWKSETDTYELKSISEAEE